MMVRRINPQEVMAISNNKTIHKLACCTEWMAGHDEKGDSHKEDSLRTVQEAVVSSSSRRVTSSSWLWLWLWSVLLYYINLNG